MAEEAGVTRDSVIEQVNNHFGQESGPQANDRLIKISVDGTCVTKSTMKGYEDTIPLLFTNLEFFSDGPDSNVSAGSSGGSKITISDAWFVVPGNADLGALPAALSEGKKIDIEYIKVKESSGKKAAAYGRTLKQASIVASVEYSLGDKYQSFKISAQNLEFTINKFDENGVKVGVASAGSFDAASGESGGA